MLRCNMFSEEHHLRIILCVLCAAVVIREKAYGETGQPFEAFPVMVSVIYFFNGFQGQSEKLESKLQKLNRAERIGPWFLLKYWNQRRSPLKVF